MPDLLDTDVFVDHLRGHRRLPARPDAAYSVVTRCELFAGSAAEDEALRTLLAPLRELAVDREVAELAGRVRHETKVATPDALVAATAIAHRLTLVTRNRRDFERVPRLRVRAPATRRD
jgi:predicted nucleic acid-binding protein